MIYDTHIFIVEFASAVREIELRLEFRLYLFYLFPVIALRVHRSNSIAQTLPQIQVWLFFAEIKLRSRKKLFCGTCLKSREIPDSNRFAPRWNGGQHMVYVSADVTFSVVQSNCAYKQVFSQLYWSLLLPFTLLPDDVLFWLWTRRLITYIYMVFK